MLAITLGYAEKGPSAEPIVLYAGRDAAKADDLSLQPPAGILRTELFKHPIVVRRRNFDEVPVAIAPEAVVESAELADDTAGSKRRK